MTTLNEDRNKHRRRWKAITLDYERVVAQELNDPSFHCLSATTRLILLSLIDVIKWSTRYDVPLGVTVDKGKIMDWYELAAYELSGGQMLRGNGCKLESSCDGVTWVTLIDFGTCLTDGLVSGGMGDQTAITYETNITEVTNNYDGTLGSIGVSDLSYDGGSGDADRDNALCSAIRSYIDAIARTWVEKDQANDSRNRLIATAGIAFGAGVLALATAGVGNLIAGAVGSAIALIAVNIDLEDETQLYAPSTLDAVQCCMYDALTGTTPTEVSFNSAASACGFDPLSYEGKLAQIVNEVSSTREAYLSFLKLWNEAVSYANSGLLSNECAACNDWVHVFDFTTGDLQGWVMPPGGLSVLPTISSPDGIKAGVIGTGGGRWMGLVLNLDFQEAFITHVTMDYWIDRGGELPFTGDSARFANEFGQWWFNEGENQSFSRSPNGLLTSLYNTFYMNYNGGDNQPPGGEGYIRNMVVYGTGFNPFV